MWDVIYVWHFRHAGFQNEQRCGNCNNDKTNSFYFGFHRDQYSTPLQFVKGDFSGELICEVHAYLHLQCLIG